MNRHRAETPRRLAVRLSVMIALLTSAGGGTEVRAQNGSLRGVQPREVVLDNGLKVLLVERHEQPTIAAGVFYKVGAVNDPRGKSGIAHLFEHMLFKGSRVIGTTDYEAERKLIEQQDALREKMIAEMNRMREMKRRGEITDVLDPAQWTSTYREYKKQYDQLVEKARQYIKNNELANLYTTNGGARLNAGTMHDATIYFVELPANKIELFFWLESDRMANGVMREFYVERDNVREERRLRVESTPTGKFDEAFEAMFWEAHPYGIPVIGWPSEVESITRDDVRSFYKIYYAPNNATVVLVGDFQTDDMIRLAKKYFGRLPRGPRTPPPVLTEEPPPLAQRRFYAEAETNPRVRIRFHGVPIGHTDEAALDVLGELLSGKTGRLYKRLVEKEDIAIGQPFAGHQARKYAGHFEINVTVKEGKSPEDVEKMVLEELEKLRTERVSDYELQKVKNQVLAASVRRLRSNFGLMLQLGLYETWYKWQYINEGPQRMMAVTADDVQRVAQAYLDPDTRTVAIYRTKQAKPAAATATMTQPPASEGHVAAGGEQNPSGGESFESDPAYKELAAKLPKKWRVHLKRRMKQLQTLTDPEDIDYRADVLEAGLDSPRMTPRLRSMFEYVIKKMRERSRELRLQRWLREQEKNKTQEKEPK